MKREQQINQLPHSRYQGAEQLVQGLVGGGGSIPWWLEGPGPARVRCKLKGNEACRHTYIQSMPVSEVSGSGLLPLLISSYKACSETQVVSCGALSYGREDPWGIMHYPRQACSENTEQQASFLKGGGRSDPSPSLLGFCH